MVGPVVVHLAHQPGHLAAGDHQVLLLEIDGRVVDLQAAAGQLAAVVVETPEEHQPQGPPGLGPRRQKLTIGGEHLLDLDQHVAGGRLAQRAVQGEPLALVKQVPDPALVALDQPHGVHFAGLDLRAVDELLDLPAELLLAGGGQGRDPLDRRALDRPDHQAGGPSPGLPDLDPIDPDVVLRLDQAVQRAAACGRGILTAAEVDGFRGPIARRRADHPGQRQVLTRARDDQNRPGPAKSGNGIAKVLHLSAPLALLVPTVF